MAESFIVKANDREAEALLEILKLGMELE